MAEGVDTEDQFNCSICLDLFKKPVTTPCGHNFCQTCITVNWDLNRPHVCPLCKQRFSSRPSLKINTLLAEMVAKIKSKHKAWAGPGEVPCDACPEPKLKALKSCLNCVASYCESHLKPHQVAPGLKTHELIKPVQNLQDRVCSKHNLPLKHFCQTDKLYLCVMCSHLDHGNHKRVTLKEEYERKKSSLLLTQTKNQDLVMKRRQKIQEIQCSVRRSQRESDREMDAGQQTVTALIKSVQRSLNQFLEKVHEKQKQTRKQAQDLVQKLEQEISELEKRGTELEKLICSEDHFYLLQHSTSLPLFEVKDWNGVSVEMETCKAAQLLSELKELINAQINKNVLERAQQFAVDIVLDSSTANANLTLSRLALKQVHHTDTRNTFPESTQRFSDCPGVLGRQGFSSVRFYFEVQVREKTEWYIGVALESVSRKGSISLNPDCGYRSIGMRKASEYYACTGDRLFLKSAPLEVGVFVDCPRGKVDFYDVHTADLIHSFTDCKFPQKLLPFFSPGYNHGETNSAPLVLKAVKNLGNPSKKGKR
ncbi:E3 ubiquitin-protein ligase TRIM39-like [Eucyclogobius newberryi]|uniref:E3 ubiquitin-protein ligase TRIM39-like n=1 Tax=Eucyclogobius newberryi TaxID=166745 RepID=UPI003B5C29E8